MTALTGPWWQYVCEDVGLHYEVFSSVNGRPRLEDLCSSGNALPKKVEQVGKGNKNSGDIYGSEVWGPGMSLAVRDITQERDLFDHHRCVVPTTK